MTKRFDAILFDAGGIFLLPDPISLGAIVRAHGGDGSIEGAKALSREHQIPIIGIPKTIDNDVAGTDVAIGYDTALNTAMEAIDKIRDTAQSHERVFIVEVMGRDSGYIAYGAGLAVGAESILIPEITTDYESLQNRLQNGLAQKKESLIIVVAEGDESGGAAIVAEKIKKIIPSKYVGVSILGHMQRGGSPSAFDRILAAKFGFAAVENLLLGKSNVMIGMQKNEICCVPFQDIKRNHLNINDREIKFLNALTN